MATTPDEGRLSPGDRPQVIRETDAEALRLARTLARGARHAALAVLEPETGFPFVSRVLTATDPRGMPVVLASALSTHTKGLNADPRASLLFGEPGKGDPLAHPRLTIECEAVKVTKAEGEHAVLRRRFLARHPKAELYIDFPDFCFFRLAPRRASLNAGFGRAYRLDGADLVIASTAADALVSVEPEAIAHMNDDHAEAVELYARFYAKEAGGSWRMTGIDAAGIDIASGDRLRRIEFEAELQDPAALRSVLVAMAKRARELS